MFQLLYYIRIEYSIKMSTGTTNIDDLPIPPTSSVQNVSQPFLGQTNANNNIKLELSDIKTNTVKEHPINNQTQYQQPQIQLQPQQQLNNNNNNNNNNTIDINQFISGLQKASSDGVLSLPQRDIPITQNHITQDPQIQANYIPSHLHNGDYINQYMPKDEIMRRTLGNNTKQVNDEIYNDLQIPLLIFILYFIFNLPFVRKNMFTYLPVFFNKDGNLTGGGHLFHGIVFSIICFGVFKGVKYLSA